MEDSKFIIKGSQSAWNLAKYKEKEEILCHKEDIINIITEEGKENKLHQTELNLNTNKMNKAHKNEGKIPQIEEFRNRDIIPINTSKFDLISLKIKADIWVAPKPKKTIQNKLNLDLGSVFKIGPQTTRKSSLVNTFEEAMKDYNK